ncbi:MAG: hypothetical protein FWE77_06155 [Clostridia bacterium]|nr:hypothetical protein [Clostridia bacterium]
MAKTKRRFARWLPWALGAAALALGAALALLLWAQPGAPSWDASTPLQAGDLVAGSHRAGAEVRGAAQYKDAPWHWEGMTLYFTGTPPRLTGANIYDAYWAGPRGLRVGDTLEALYRVIPVTEYEEPPEDFVLLYAAGILPGGLPEQPYAVIVPSGEALLVRLVAQTESGDFALCHVYVDPDTGLIERIRWEIAPADDLWERLSMRSGGFHV